MASKRAVAIASLLAVTVGVSLGVFVGLELAPAPQPGVIASSDDPQMLIVSPRVFEDQRQMALTPHLSQKRVYYSEASGVLSESRCKPGKAIVSGSSPWVVDDRRLVVLRLKRPPWRDLGLGLRGADVTDFQRELRRLGYNVATDGFYSLSMYREVQKFWLSLGVKDTGVLPLDRVVWIRQSKSVVPVSCDLKVGDRLAGRSPIFSQGGRLESVTISVPEAVVPGRREAVLDSGTVGTITSEALIVDEAFLGEFAETKPYRDWAADSSSVLSVRTRLAEPLTVFPVPPQALYGVASSSGCVESEVGPVEVGIVASELGVTLIQVTGSIESVWMPARKDASSCK